MRRLLLCGYSRRRKSGKRHSCSRSMAGEGVPLICLAAGLEHGRKPCRVKRSSAFTTFYSSSRKFLDRTDCNPRRKQLWLLSKTLKRPFKEPLYYPIIQHNLQKPPTTCPCSQITSISKSAHRRKSLPSRVPPGIGQWRKLTCTIASPSCHQRNQQRLKTASFAREHSTSAPAYLLFQWKRKRTKRTIGELGSECFLNYCSLFRSCCNIRYMNRSPCY